MILKPQLCIVISLMFVGQTTAKAVQSESELSGSESGHQNDGQLSGHQGNLTRHTNVTFEEEEYPAEENIELSGSESGHQNDGQLSGHQGNLTRRANVTFEEEEYPAEEYLDADFDPFPINLYDPASFNWEATECINPCQIRSRGGTCETDIECCSETFKDNGYIQCVLGGEVIISLTHIGKHF